MSRPLRRLNPGFMPYFVRILTAAAIFVHSTAGCCAHEGHHTAVHSCQHADSHDARAHGHGVKTAAGATLLPKECCSDHDSQQPGPESCRHANCTWPSPEVRHGADLLQLSFGSSPACPLDSPLLVPFSVGQVLGPSIRRLLSPHALPVRAHLANCVFLI